MQVDKGYLKRQVLRVLMLAGITFAIAQALQAMGVIGVVGFTWPGLAFVVIGLAVALACFSQLKYYYRQDNPARSRREPEDAQDDRND